MKRRQRQRGMTLIELIVSFTILLTLSSMAVPLARYKVRRDREKELRYSLREVRAAIDKYKDLCDYGKIPPGKIGTNCYPENLDVLVEGVKQTGTVDTKIKFLRRLPKDPFTNSTDWGKRSDQDDPKSMSWGGQNVFDVFTKSTEKSREGTPYAEW